MYCGWSWRTMNASATTRRPPALHAAPTRPVGARRPSRAARAGAVRRCASRRRQPVDDAACTRRRDRGPARVPAPRACRATPSTTGRSAGAARAPSPGRISTNGNSGFHSSEPYANTHQPAPFGFAASVAVSDSRAARRRARGPVRPAPRRRARACGPDSRSSRHSVVRSLLRYAGRVQLAQFDVRLAPLRARGLAVRPALAEQRRARDRDCAPRAARAACVASRASSGHVPGSGGATPAARGTAARARTTRRPRAAGRRAPRGAASCRPIGSAAVHADRKVSAGKPSSDHSVQHDGSPVVASPRGAAAGADGASTASKSASSSVKCAIARARAAIASW